ncbi:helix-turn-helix domain-containing protein [Ornithinibacillus gellani]|uniref:AraC family transcriptional regulator n=1 Tax=Ornithinibacillus gellani TaxID=2293253 RepID=UPI000F46D012|nr:AraC family transcriptional regulator [Ornithinibacillus gellani]TQS75101.1 helix-turn-helix domain-containing protein [Ornithinibacillus gellani]
MSHEVYKLEQAPEDTIPFKLLYITHSEYDKGWHSTKHTHHFTELFYIVNGKGSFLLTEHEIPVKENDLVIINPNVEHTERSNAQDSLEYIALGIEGISFSLPEEKGEAKIGLFTYQGDRKDILFFLKKLLDEVQLRPKNYEAVCRNIIDILLIKLHREKDFVVENKKSHRMNQSVALVKHYINQNFRDNITLDQLAQIGNINKYYLSHCFKEDLGISPIGYLNEVRIREAKNLLETTDYTIAEIATFNGFSSQSFFSQAFKRETGETPSVYRRTITQQTPV